MYVGASAYDSWVSRHWLVSSPAPRLVVHVVRDGLAERLRVVGDHFVPARVAAVDVAELGTARSIEAALGVWGFQG